MKIVGMARPYLYAAPKRYSSLSYSLPTRIALLDLTERGEEASLDALSFAEIESPDVLIVARFTETPLPSGVRSWYPHVLVSSTTSGRTVEIFSKAPSHPPERTEYGYGALPGVLGSFETPDGVLFQLGAFDLMLSSSQDSFNKSRLTSRRLASALKYSAEPRIVVGAFRASVTSQLVNMYSDQLKLRSIFFDGGLSRLWRCLVGSIALSQNLNAFTAKNIELLGQREVPPNSQGLAAILFTVRVPRPRGS
jgi:hypothetical protein